MLEGLEGWFQLYFWTSEKSSLQIILGRETSYKVYSILALAFYLSLSKTLCVFVWRGKCWSLDIFDSYPSSDLIKKKDSWILTLELGDTVEADLHYIYWLRIYNTLGCDTSNIINKMVDDSEVVFRCLCRAYGFYFYFIYILYFYLFLLES